MCKGDKKCKACAAAQIGKKMAKSRKSTKSLAMDGLLYVGGGAIGKWGIPKLKDMVAPTADDKIVSGIVAVAGLFGSQYVAKVLGHEAGKIAFGIGIGAGIDVVTEVAGLGYVINPNTNLENIIGMGGGNFPDSRWNAGEM